MRGSRRGSPSGARAPRIMRSAAFALLLACAAWASPITPASDPPGEPGQVFVLQDYRWVPVIVRRSPTAVECHFEVVSGGPTVHAELLSERDFMLFAHHREYETLADSRTASSGEFRRVLETPGRYRILVRNEPGATPAAVSLIVRTELDPPPDLLSSGVSPRRKAAVIVLSLAAFFATAFWSGRKLLRAAHRR